MEAIDYEWVFLLSIDVEGLDAEVLKGAAVTLQKTLFVCVEANDADTRQAITETLEPGSFQLEERLGCNLVFRNENPELHKYLRKRQPQR